MSTKQQQQWMCSEYLLGQPHFNRLAKPFPSKTKEEAALSFVREQYDHLGYPRKHRTYINDDGTIFFFDVRSTVSLEIENSGTINS